MRARTIAGVIAGAGLLTCGTVLPAAANDVYLKGGPGDRSSAAWADRIDKLSACLGGTPTARRAVTKISPASGSGPSFSVTDYSLQNGCTSTGNLSIPEDRRYVMTLTVVTETRSYVTSTEFYT